MYAIGKECGWGSTCATIQNLLCRTYRKYKYKAYVSLLYVHAYDVNKYEGHARRAGIRYTLQNVEKRISLPVNDPFSMN